MVKDVESILEYSQDYPFKLNAENLISQWREAKDFFYHAFDNRYILRSSDRIEVTLSTEERRRRFSDFILSLDGRVSEEFIQFLQGNERGFFDNKVVFPMPSKDIKLGSKLSKSFKKFYDTDNDLRWVQDQASRYMQEDKIKGYLFLSVDPRDFLTLSENNANWYSCHSLDGDYRAGNLSYMVDSSTMIAYLAEDKLEHLKCLPDGMKWYNKKWRMLIHTDKENCIYYSRQYPYVSSGLLNEVYKMVNNFFIDKFNEPRTYGFRTINDTYLSVNQLCFGGQRLHSTIDVIDDTDYLGYNDLVRSDQYVPIASLNDISVADYTYDIFYAKSKEEEEKLFKKLFGVKIGEKPICPCCGDEVVEREDKFLCNLCIAENDADDDFYLRCEDCGHRIYPEDDRYLDVEGMVYCKHCYNQLKKLEWIEWQ